MRHPVPDPPLPGQESVWIYPCPAIAQPIEAHIVIVLGGEVIAETSAAVRTLETSHTPSYYLPPGTIRPRALVPTAGSSFCEWKDRTRYFDVIGGERRSRAAWSYPDPTAGFVLLRNHFAFYAAAMDGCFVDGEGVTPRFGGFYGGWITFRVAGPFRGGRAAPAGEARSWMRAGWSACSRSTRLDSRLCCATSRRCSRVIGARCSRRCPPALAASRITGSARASKAALNMIVCTAAIELARTRPRVLCVGLHPGTVDTGLSQPFQRGMPADRLFTPDFAAERLLKVLEGLDKESHENAARRQCSELELGNPTPAL